MHSLKIVMEIWSPVGFKPRTWTTTSTDSTLLKIRNALGSYCCKEQRYKKWNNGLVNIKNEFTYLSWQDRTSPLVSMQFKAEYEIAQK